ncbi:MAG: ATPase [Bifidobacterium bifidum]|nr:ATPase [Bifidobacterium bifidum]
MGDVLLVGTDFYRKVPHDVWPLKPRVGIVRRALNEGVVLETSDGLGPDGAHFGAAPALGALGDVGQRQLALA